MTVIADLIIIGTKISSSIKTLSVLYSWAGPIYSKLKWAKKAVDTVTPITNKIGIFKRIKYFIMPRAKLTYWLADEEVVVYVSDFQQKDKFKLIFKELETGRLVMVNSGNAINYRLEELKPEDQIEHTQIEQNQHY